MNNEIKQNTSNGLKVISVKFAPWDNEYYFLSKDKEGNELDIKVKDKVLVETAVGSDVAVVVKIKDKEDSDVKSTEQNVKKHEHTNSRGEVLDIKPIIRLANEKDLEVLKKNNLNNHKILRESRRMAKKYELNMKITDLHVSYDDVMLVMAFIADGRVDFRELVKVLSKKYRKKIRLYQLGVRDEARICGDIGDCGQELCCKRFLSRLESITTGFARDQQVSHRGLDKLSGVCGRLKCCLAYEESTYKEKLIGLPQLGDTVKVKQGSGYVMDINPLQRKVKIRIREDNSVVEVQY
jgi:cell fate regulator YaaT (PSP1 superfamily)